MDQIILLKDFKVRGKRMEEIVKVCEEYIEKAKAIWIKLTTDVVIKFRKLEVVVKRVSLDAYARVMKLKVPYTNKTVSQVIQLTKEKLDEPIQKLEKMNVTQLINEIEEKIMNFEIEGKSIKEYVVLGKKKLAELKKEIQTFLEENLSKLPEVIRKSLHKLVSISRKYITDVKAYIKIVSKYMNKVVKSVLKNFGPLYDDIIKELKKIKLPSIKPIIEDLKKVYNFMLPLVKPLVPLYEDLKNQVRDITVNGIKIGTFVDKEIAKLDQRIQLALGIAKALVKEKVDMLRRDIARLENMTADEIVDLSVTSTVKAIKLIISYMEKMYKEKGEIVEKIVKEVKQVYEKIKSLVPTNVTVDLVTKKVVATIGELSSVINQLADFDISNPVWKAWIAADLIGLLEKYGVNDKVAAYIKLAKDVNITIWLSDNIKAAEKIITATTKTITAQVVRAYHNVYNKVVKILEYISSIPKKEYKAWLHEVETFVSTNKQLVIKRIKTIYARLIKECESAEAIVKAEIIKIYNESVAVTKKLNQWYTLVASRAERVLEEVRQPTIDVFKHYKDAVTIFVKQQYKIIMPKVVAECKRICDQVKTMVAKLIAELKNKVDVLQKAVAAKVVELEVRVKTMYKDFITKYGNMTWGDVENEIEKVLLKQYNEISQKYRDAKLIIEKQYKAVCKQLNAFKSEIKEKAIQIYKEAVAKYGDSVAVIKAKLAELKKYIKDKYDEIKPKMVKLYNKYKQLVEEEAAKLIAQVKKVYAKAYSQVLKLYGKIKDKNLKELVLKIKTVVIPEVLTEMESILNQTLRNTVIMTKEIIKAYRPHAKQIKDAVEKYVLSKLRTAIEKVKGLVAKINLDEVQRLVNETVAKVEKKIRELIEKVKTSDKYTKLVAKLREAKKLIEDKFEEFKNDPVVMKIRKDMKAAIEIIKNAYTEIKNNPTILKIEKELKTLISELKKFIKENPIVVKFKGKVEEIVSLINNITITVQNTLKQMKKSGQFSAQKLQENLMPYINDAIKNTKLKFAQTWDDIKKVAIDFVQNPEETFWTEVSVAKQILIDAYRSGKSITTQQIVDACRELSNRTMTFGKQLALKCTDKWTKDVAVKVYHQAKNIVVDIVTVFRDIIGNPTFLEEFFSNTLSSVKQWIESEISKIKIYWKSSTFGDFVRAIVENPLWKELADEVERHELVVMLKEKLAVVKKIYNENKVIMEKLIVGLKKWIEEGYKIIRNETIAMYKKAVEEYNNVITITKKLLNETTTADVVTFIQKKYDILKEKLVVLKEKLDKLKEITKTLYVKYEVKIKEIMKKYEVEIKQYYDNVRAKVVEMYKKYRPLIEQEYTKIVNEATAIYQKLEEVIETEYKDITVKVKELYKKVKSRVTVEYKDLVDKWNKSSLRQKLMAFKKMTIAETIEVLKELPSEVRKYIVTACKVLIKDFDKLLVKVAAEVKTACKQVTDKVSFEIKSLLKKYQPLITKVNDVYKWVENEVKETVLFVYKYYKLEQKYDQIKAFIAKVTNEIVAQAKVVAKKMKQLAIQIPDMLKKQLTKYMGDIKKLAKKIQARTEELIVKIKQMLPKIADALEKYVEQYKKFVEKCKTFVNVYAKRAVDILEDKILRGIYDGLKKVATIEKDMEKLVAKIRQSINITRDGETIRIAISHPEITPSFTHILEVIKQSAKELVKRVKEEGVLLKQTLEQFIKNVTEKIPLIIEDIRTEVIALKASAERYVQEVEKYIKEAKDKLIKEVPAMIAKVSKVIKDKVAELEEYIKVVKEKATVIVSEVDKFIKYEITQISKVKKIIEAAFVKAQKTLVELKQRIMKSETYIKFVALVEKKLAALKKFVKEKIVELKTNPTLIKIKSQIKKLILDVIAEIKTKGAELVKTVKEEFVILRARVEKYIQIIKEKAPIVINNATKIIKDEFAALKVIVEKYVRIIKEKAPIMMKNVTKFINDKVVKAKEIIEATIAKVEQKLKEVQERIVKSKSYIKLVDFIEKELPALEKLIKEKLQELKTNPTLIKVISQIRNITLEAIKELKTKGAELLKKIEEEVIVLRKKVEKYIQIIKEKAPIMIKNATEFINDEFVKAKEVIEAIIAKLKQRLKELKERIVKSESYIKLVDIVEKQLTALKKFIKERLQELKNNPTLIKIRSEIRNVTAEVIETLKTKGTELLEKVRKEVVILKAKVEKYIKVIKEKHQS